jgi:hypothetical protein
MRTVEEIGKAIKKLKELETTVIPRSTFGDDNVAAVQAQRKVLEQNLDEDDIDATWPEEDDSYVRDEAMDALRWLDGEISDEDAFDWPVKP